MASTGFSSAAPAWRSTAGWPSATLDSMC
jgi:hypothetical protein